VDTLVLYSSKTLKNRKQIYNAVQWPHTSRWNFLQNLIKQSCQCHRFGLMSKALESDQQNHQSVITSEVVSKKYEM